jgi:sigma-B regulation protein RsbU (phosphoserine phosphatase)
MEKTEQSLPANSRGDVQSELDERLVELTSLFEVTQRLDASLGLKSILDHILLTAMGKMLIGKGVIFLSRDGFNFKVETSKGIMEEKLNTLSFTLDPASSKSLLVEEATGEREAWISALQELGIVLILPMRAGERTMGFVCFGQKPTGSDYQSAEIDFLTSLTNIASTSVQNGLVVEQLRIVNKRLDRKIQELNTLFDIGKELNSSLNPRKILQLLTYAVMGQMAINRSLILVFREQSIEKSCALGVCRMSYPCGIRGQREESLGLGRECTEDRALLTSLNFCPRWPTKG